ncbi:hypothetical protein EOA27_30325 [Mesorhizobium sp. M2A.F.Ca.ET.037.01.1.1]|uniref:hypothetical protein n=1 Tax=unclassified Mesorhizobium TaxID=325217 RepID=UPI000FCBD42E|nr:MULTISPECIES: hypothetical protein [unclassified Mesorhizobium]RVC61163.1 hypothetical protein EN759_29745 [Mesorhizobium sp. M00.F.Ca.ET.038.03.1.1]RVC71399.1 hypothetical protein EN766_27075 [Mesorhizobium sp. M2A.F.Ca.ET.046.02.1.1]RUX04084.1 hypothetical protein EOA27_30325 [Mesorhizobium sp. M2A.F.Ca.ET.037.01.1.1]RWA94042.1 MAG: hypothetical protein EOQ31_02885 [Mesorhizobium sp.]RWB38952.1 MAG: hypothetical protein EOQ44_29755 [Mesorhizobium sp.]
MSNKYYTTESKVRQYEAVIGVFTELFKELKDLGKKKPEGTLSTSKVNLINRVLADAVKLLEGAPDHKYLDLLDSDSLPQYGDAILILSQYEGALKSFYERHYGYQSGVGDAWFIQPKKSG